MLAYSRSKKIVSVDFYVLLFCIFLAVYCVILVINAAGFLAILILFYYMPF